jgi:hypothetical protein
MNKLERKQLQQKHQPYNGWTHFTQTKQQQPVSYRTKQQERDHMKLEKETWK